MGKYAYSKRADRDIGDITLWSLERFGKAQTQKYMNGLAQTLQMLSNNEVQGSAFTSKRTNRKYLRYRYISHMIFYRERKDDIFITRILHIKMLPEKHLQL